MSNVDFDRLRRANEKRAKEWDVGGQMSLTFRVGEACNVIKKIEWERMGLVGSRATMEMLAEEIADVVICADLIAMATGIDLGEAVRNKFNKTSVKYGLETRVP